MRITIAFVSVLLLIGVSCNKSGQSNIEGGVALHLLSDYEVNNESEREIIFESAVTEEEPFISYTDLVIYNRTNYEFTITEKAKEKISNMDHSVSGIAFGLMANNDLIYTGYFRPSFSSFANRALVIDPVSTSLVNENKMKIQSFHGIEDKRNDPSIINIFSRDNKLTE